MDLKTLRELGARCGIPMVGCIPADDLSEYREGLEARNRAGEAPPFVGTEPAARVAYRRVFPEAQSVVVIGVPYALNVALPAQTAGRGRLSAFLQGQDYHQVVRQKMEALARLISDEAGPMTCRFFVDNGALVDRAAAHKAGLGFYGKNNTLINPRYGSGFFIGQLLVDADLQVEQAEPLACRCGGCRRCVDACPNGALGDEGFFLKGSRCISALTQQKKLSPAQEVMISDYLYGCDFCQRVCPFNAGQPAVIWDDGPLACACPELDAVLALDDDAFEAAFGQSAMAWRGRAVLQRNAKILKNRENR
jgi:epoxyqueuosine reductase